MWVQLHNMSDTACWDTFSAYCAQKNDNPSLRVLFSLTLRQSRLLSTHLQTFTKVRKPKFGVQHADDVVFYEDASATPFVAASRKRKPDNSVMFASWIKFGNVWLRCLFDTGASHSMIDADAAAKCPGTVDPYAAVPALCGADGKHLSLMGTLTNNLSVGQYKVRRQPLIVMRDMLPGYHVILGMDWMRANKCNLFASSLSMQIVSAQQGTLHFSKEFFLSSEHPPGHEPAASRPNVIASVSKLKRLVGKGAKLILVNVTRLPPAPSANDGGRPGLAAVAGPAADHSRVSKEGERAPHDRRSLLPSAPSRNRAWNRKRYGSISSVGPDEPRSGAMSSPSLTQSANNHTPAIPSGNMLDPVNQDDSASSQGVSFSDAGADTVQPELAEKLKQLPDKLQRVIKRYWKVFQPLLPGLDGKYRYQGEVIPTEPHTPPFRPMYRLSPAELAEVTKQVALYLEKGWIRPSDSPYGAPILFAQKADGTLRMCIDYRALNKVTIKNRYPLPNIQDLLDMLHGSAVFSSLDLVSGYHQIALQESDVRKTAFRTPLGHFECLVLWEGLTNAPSVFQSIMQKILQPFIGKFAALYIDDILVFSKTEDEHVAHLEAIFNALEAAELHVKLPKCSFFQKELRFLGHIVSKDGTRMDPKKVKSVGEWPRPMTTKQLQQFLGLCNYFRRYIAGYATISAPLYKLQHHVGRWPPGLWADGVHGAAFDALKHALTSRDVLLALPDMRSAANGTLPFTVMCDASKVGAGAVLIQDGKPVAYFSKQFTSTEIKFGAGDREMCAIIFALKEWRCYLEGVKFVLKTDHEPLLYFETVSQLSRRKASYLDFLSRFTYDFHHIPGKSNVVADCLSRNPSWGLTDEHFDDPLKGVIAPVTRSGKVGSSADAVHVPQKRKYNAFADDDGVVRDDTAIVEPGLDTHVQDTLSYDDVSISNDAQGINPLITAILKAYATDPTFKDKRALKKYVKSPTGLYLVRPDKVKKKKNHVGLLQSQIVVPNDQSLRNLIIQRTHEPPYAGHRSSTSTADIISRDFFWHGMVEDVRRFVAACDTCQRTKSRTAKQNGLMLPLEVPTRKWGSVSMDMITSLPRTAKQNDAILVIVDRMTKFCHFIPCKTTATAQQCAQLFHDNVTKHFGLPDDVVSDRDSRFGTGAFIREMWRLFGTHQSPSTAYRPQSDGQTERTNRVLHEYLRAYISSTHKDWDTHLSNAQFAVNNSYNSSIGCSPFFLNYGFHPRTPTSLHIPKDSKVPAAADFVVFMQDCLAKAKLCLQRAQDRTKVQYDKNKRDMSFEVGEEVMLSSRNLKLSGCAKYIPRFVGPFKVLHKIGSLAYRLELPQNWHIHDVFHVSLLKKYVRGESVGIPPLPSLLDDYSFVIDSLVDHRILHPGKQLQFRVHYANSSEDNDTWEYERDIVKQFPSLVADYKLRYALE